MNTNMEKNYWHTIVIGGGQAGLATGYHLKKMNIDFLILDAEERTGDSWRRRWNCPSKRRSSRRIRGRSRSSTRT